MFADPLREIRLRPLCALAQRTMPDIFDTLFLTLVGMRQCADRKYDGYEIHCVVPPSIERFTTIKTEFANR